MTTAFERETNIPHEVLDSLLPKEPPPDLYHTKRRGHRRLLHKQKRRALDAYRRMMLDCTGAVNDFTRTRMRETSFFRAILTDDPQIGMAAVTRRGGPNGSLLVLDVPGAAISDHPRTIEEEIWDRRTDTAFLLLKGCCVVRHGVVKFYDVPTGWHIETYDRYQYDRACQLAIKRKYLLVPEAHYRVKEKL